MTRIATAAVLLTLVLDAALAEPPRRAHPVAWFGSAVARLDRDWSHPRAVGLLIAGLLPLAAALAAAGTVRFLLERTTPDAVSSVLLVALTAGWLFVTTSRRMLLDRATAVLEAVDRDPAGARATLRSLVGRETATLSPAELRSAAVESAAENLADGLVAPLFAFTLVAPVSVASGVGAAVWVKAVNTLDSMLGYPGTAHGAASATLDDLVNWLPARLSALLLAVVARDPGALRRAGAWARRPASPNSGWPMATLAAIIDSQLVKPGEYRLNPGAALPTDAAARRGLQLVDRAAVLAFLLMGVALWF